VATRIEIKCIKKSDRSSAHERIERVGGVNADGTRWNLPLDDAIKGVKDDKYDFWTKGGGKTVDVIVAKHNGHEYLKTKNDGIQPDNLLALDECPK
jgi:hypothetical protein